ncbi:hypothetical protein [Paenibacillus sp. L3-i20]|uniref:hypothetical protein n=1 Tax=Paenibacillus sp. L3-i20 TaxID=2905833 RepID=UPI001EDE96E6|nr:hypothetical protein [Paenibacillus sp. L3-i20]GKU76906.1 hypothetical protein L3i20_v213030 [Paenibacillus sp. L3-i20]
MKNKFLKLAVVVAVVGAGVWGSTLWTSNANSGATHTAGTIEDPVVTKSYVDEQIAKLSAGGSSGGTTGGTNGSDAGTSTKLEVVEVPVGKTLMAAAGSEVVVRVGKAVAFSSDTNGISDLTDGIDIKNGKNVPTNHLIWFPRDGRGIKGHSDESIPLTLLVKGNYTIK